MTCCRDTPSKVNYLLLVFTSLAIVYAAYLQFGFYAYKKTASLDDGVRYNLVCNEGDNLLEMLSGMKQLSLQQSGNWSAQTVEPVDGVVSYHTKPGQFCWLEAITPKKQSEKQV